MAKKAEAWREYREAAMVDMLLEALPKVWEIRYILEMLQSETNINTPIINSVFFLALCS